MFTSKLYSLLFGLRNLSIEGFLQPVKYFRQATPARRHKERQRIPGDKLATKAMNHKLGLGHPR